MAVAQDKTISVYFEFGEATLTMEERMRLLFFVEDSLDKKQYNLQLKGYCDFIDSDAFNDSLSLQRAYGVKDILLANGFRESQVLSVEGFGEKRSSQKQASEAMRRQQRRVDILFIDKNKILVQEKEVPAVKEQPAKEQGILKGKTIDEIAIGENLVLENMHFYGGRHHLLQPSKPVLLELLKIMQDNPTLRILIVGHICCQELGMDGYDMDTKTYELSVNRAKEVYTFLLRSGIDPRRMSYEGRGSNEKLYAVEVNDQQRTANRRVEIVIVDK